MQGRSVQGGYTNPLRKRLGGDVLYDADMRKQVSLNDALHLLANFEAGEDRHARI